MLSDVEAKDHIAIWDSCLQAARHRLPQVQTQAPVVAQIPAARMTAQVAAVTPVVIVKKTSQPLAVTAAAEQHQSIVMFPGIMLTSHTDLSEADEHSMPQEAVWSNTVIVITKMDTAGMMSMTDAVMTGNTQEAIVTGSTLDAVMGETSTEQSLLLTPQPDALPARLVFPAVTGHRFKRVWSKAETHVCKLANLQVGSARCV